MRKLAINTLVVFLCVGLSSVSIADDTEMRFDSSKTVVSHNQSHCNELLLGAVLQFAWNYTYRKRAEQFTQSVVDGFSGTSDDGESGLPIYFNFESSLHRTAINVEYRF